ncbi:MAG: elongation factor 4 [Candidatus Portnoybacteria bacterium CG10_big_fil_rev_8_21_14_0_10_36_7]|uniref:Elongation factor 4 n=1 Tax=Candidatus Portnoybacteria bacterium CG10_big_fil_rev_8_21_14_0_10_36_7 TaxID=1974812 RepID=A0A2M8KE17_9BACT|nr:MAG: elongation factor 4 [Candidatus Portnoybacteria bacterium CG10_big_fil_rev_8_21_14_0_10_36_7]
MNNIRNFAIIAHIDHGKSTLADRFLEITETIIKSKMQDQFLDQMDLEREKGITIKLQPIRMNYNYKGKSYMLNLIDTPGHVDFTYEVSRSMVAVEGVILLVDAVKGVQAQTLANLSLAMKQNLKIIPVINKIDLPSSRVDEVEEELAELLRIEPKTIMRISAKSGLGVKEVLGRVIEKVPPPDTLEGQKLKALIFDSKFDSFKGIIIYIRVFSGSVKLGDKFLLMASGAEGEIKEAGIFKPNLVAVDKLESGQIGYVATGLKDVSQTRIGDTITLLSAPIGSSEAMPGYQEPKPMVYASFYPQDADQYSMLKDAIAKLKLNDASFYTEPESSQALGRGFKGGFLGLLHLEIIGERLRREFDLNLTITAPSVSYKVVTKDCNELMIHSASRLPDPTLIERTEEPWVKLEIIAPPSYLGAIMQVCQDLGGIYQDTQYIGKEKMVVTQEAPLRAVIIDFYDNLKNASSGYASLNWEFIEYRGGDLVRLDILVAGEKVEAFAKVIPRDKAFHEGRKMVNALKEYIPRQLFMVTIQAAVGGKILARENISALRKDVTGYLYGGDYSRKKKLLQKQKKGKEKMKESGRVRIPAEVYFKVLRK